MNYGIFYGKYDIICNFEFSVVTPKDILFEYKNFNTKQNMDIWGLSVKTVSSIITPILSIIFNEYIASGIFLVLMKQ